MSILHTKTNLIFLVLAFTIIFPLPVFAVEMFLQTATPDLGVGEEFKVEIFINTDGETINAAEGTLVFPDGILIPKSISETGSVLNFWVEKPEISATDEIKFSGIVPGGFGKNRGSLFSVIFEAKKIGPGFIEIKNGSVLLNDGIGTPAGFTVANLAFQVVRGGTRAEIKTEDKDKEPPESFWPAVSSSPDLFQGKYFLVFYTQDKGSGIDYYEVCEGGYCTKTDSPYLLKYQALNKGITVRAVDKSGNERLVAINSPMKPFSYANVISWIIMVLIVSLALFVIFKLWKRKTI